MQIHEITQVNEGVFDNIKNAAQTAATIFNNPEAMTSARGYGAAMNKHYQDKVARNQVGIDQAQAAQLAQQTQQRATQLTQQWLQYLQSKKPTGPIRAAPSTRAPLKPTGQYATNKNAGQTVDPDPSALLPEEVQGGPTPDELAKYQQKLAAASTPKTGFSALPGGPLPAGNVAKPPVKPQKNIMTGTRANEFKAWVDQQLTTKVSGTNQTISMDQVRQDPATAQKLAQLLPTIIQKNDPKAIEQYLTIAMTTMQKIAAQQRQAQQAAGGGGGSATRSVSPISNIITPQQAEQIRARAKQDPTVKWEIKKYLEL